MTRASRARGSIYTPRRFSLEVPDASVAVIVRRLALFSVGGESVSGQAPAQAPAQVTAIRAGRLLDPEGGRILTNQVIVVDGTRIRDVGPNVAIPPGARVIDLSGDDGDARPRRGAQPSRPDL